MRIDWNNLTPVSPINAISARIPAATQSDPTAALAEGIGKADFSALSSGNLTQGALRTALLEIGIAADPESLVLAEAFARLGLPLTDANMIEARAILARYPKLPPAAYALAKLLDAPLTPGILRALARIVEGATTDSSLPDTILNSLLLGIQGGDDPAEMAKQLYQLIARLGQSSEQRLSQAGDQPQVLRTMLSNDPRTQLLAIASESVDPSLRTAASAHAAHIEGQQILNQVNLKRFDPPVPLYFSFPVKISANETVAAEVQVWSRDEDDDGGQSNSDEFGESRIVLQTTLRMTTPRLGGIEVRLSGAQNADLNCSVLVERPKAYRLLRRHSGSLAEGLAGAGWTVKEVGVGMASDFAPLWFGGADLKRPRGRVDQKA